MMLREDVSFLRKMERGAERTASKLKMGEHVFKLRKILKKILGKNQKENVYEKYKFNFPD